MLSTIFGKVRSVVSESRGTTRGQRAISDLTWAAIGIALVGSILSAFGICTGGCTDAVKYRIFGLHFATVGIPFFLATLACSAGRNSKSWEVRCPYDALIFGAVGAEWFFIGVQKHIIMHYCPICLTIAGAVYVAVSLRLVELFLRRAEGGAKGASRARGLVTSFVRGAVVFCALFIGLISALIGVSTPTMAGAGPLGQEIWLGKVDSQVEVLLVTDWFCPHCKKTEPAIKNMLPAIEKVARCTFIDDPIHEASFNFMPYNMSLLMSSKENYLEGRKVLLSIAEKTQAPNDASVVAAFAAQGIKFKMAERSKLVRLASSESAFLRANSVSVTPTIVVRNRRTGEHRLLVGETNIKQDLVLAAVKSLEKM